MKKNGLIISGITMVVTIFFVVAYSLFNVFGVTQSRVRRNELTIVTYGEEKLYDELELSNDNWYIDSGELAEGDTITGIMGTTITNPGSVDNEVGITILDSEGENVTLAYKINYNYGKLTVNPIEITVKTATITKEFDGTELKSFNWDLTSGYLYGNDRLEFIMTSTITTPGQIDNEIGITIYNEDDEVVNHIYKINYDLGLLTVLAREISVSTASFQKGYDGLPLSGGNVTQIGEVAPANRIEFGPEISITDPGTVSNDVDVRIFDEAGNNVTSSYNITYNYGTLTINAVELVISSESDSKVYDGLPLSNDSWSFVHGTLIGDHQLQVNVDSEITEVGSTENIIFATVVDGVGTDVTHLYGIEYLPGLLLVSPKDLTIATESESKIFDGTELTNTNWELLIGELLDTHHIDFAMTSSITNPGDIDNEITLKIFNESNEDVTSAYDIDYVLGTLTVSSRTIEVTTDTLTKDYDGLPLLGGEATIIGELALNHHIVFGPSNSITNPEEIENGISVRIYDSLGTDVTVGYNILPDYGTLTVNPISIVLRSNDASKTYDGTPLTDNEWTLLLGEVLEGHELIVTVDNQITNPGTADNNIIAYVLNESGTDVTNLYDINNITGSLTVFPRSITITTNSYEKGYDGTPLLGGEASVEGTLVDNHYAEFGPEDSLTNPGVTNNEVTVIIYDESGNDVTIGYDVNTNFGSLIVRPISIVLTSYDASKLYDGLPLSDNSWDLVVGMMFEGHELIVNMNNELTLPGIIDNSIYAYVINESGNDVTDLYDIDYITGSLTVFPIDITVTTNTSNKGYDGTPLLGGSPILTGELLANHHIEYGVEQSITDPGSITNSVTVRVLDLGGNDVTEGYNINQDFGTLTVDPISIILSSASASKIYDATSLSDNTWELNHGSLLDGHQLIVSVSNQITNPGSIDNTISAFVINASGNDVTDIYDIDYLTGTLTIFPIDIIISTNTYSKDYDGTPLLGGDVTQAGDLINLDYIEFGPASSLTNPGTIDNEVTVTIFDDGGNVVTSSYNVIYDFGTLTVNQISLIIKSNDGNKVYDGTPLSDDTYTILNGAVLAEHTLNVDIDGELTDVGSIENSIFAFVTDALDNNVSDFYDITYNPGTLTIFSSAYSSSDIATESFDIPVVDAFSVYSSITGTIYFRDKSHGDYTGNGWTEGIAHNASITDSPFGFPVSSLQDNSYSSTLIQVEYLRDQIPFLTPYYMTDGFTGTNDIHTTGDTSGINDLNVIMYNFNELNPLSISDVPLSNQENLYQTYVYDNYLDVPLSTKTEMLALAQANGLSSGSLSIISEVASYISNAATYTLDFAPIPAGEDVAVYFLTVTQEGVCMHYAAAATLMYRSLGVPARYVTGYLGEVQADQWNTVQSTSAHAWVEVYIDGFGWVPVEVTGSSESSEPVEELIKISVKPKTVEEGFEEGKTITASEVSIFNYPSFFLDGYTYVATYSGSLSTIGTASSTITSFTIYDDLDNDVTDKFEIEYLEGTLQMYGYTLELSTSSDTKIYDGTPLTNEDYTVNGSLASNHTIAIVYFLGEQTYVGTSKNTAIMIIHDEFGADVTSYYDITTNFGDLLVNPRSITVTSGTNSKTFDGTALTDNSYGVSNGTLGLNDFVEITITGSQTGMGKSSNTISSIVIKNGTDDVTSNYIIEIIEGELSITPY